MKLMIHSAVFYCHHWPRSLSVSICLSVCMPFLYEPIIYCRSWGKNADFYLHSVFVASAFKLFRRVALIKKHISKLILGFKFVESLKYFRLSANWSMILKSSWWQIIQVIFYIEPLLTSVYGKQGHPVSGTAQSISNIILSEATK